jgi:hypothetical protein
MAYFECVVGGGGTSLTIQITTSSTVLYGQTITISKGGSTVGTTAFDNTGNAEYTVRESGTYTVSVTYSGVTFSDTVTVADTFNANVEATPTGSTATPVNDIQIWLHCANIWNKNYTAISQVLADTTTLLALINSNNAVDYMVRSTNWATSVCANSTAMTYIGANNYCANKLLSNSTWRTAICNSTYFESVLNVKVPTMTSATTPSGEVLASDYFSTEYEGFKAFDGKDSSNWNSANSGTTEYGKWIGYHFTSSVRIYKISYYTTSVNYIPKQIKAQSSQNGSTWGDAWDGTYPLHNVSSVQQLCAAYNGSGAPYFRIALGTSYGNQNNDYVIHTLQFYGRAAS